VSEAARIDGANGWQSTTRIIPPMLQRSTATVDTAGNRHHDDRGLPILRPDLRPHQGRPSRRD